MSSSPEIFRNKKIKKAKTDHHTSREDRDNEDRNHKPHAKPIRPNPQSALEHMYKLDQHHNEEKKAQHERRMMEDPKLREYFTNEREKEKARKKPEPIVYEKEINNIKYTVYQDEKRTKKIAHNSTAAPVMIEIIVNDRVGKKERIKCYPSDKVGDVKKLIGAKVGTRPEKIRLQKGYHVLSDAITLEDYEINHGSGIEMYYN